MLLGGMGILITFRMSVSFAEVQDYRASFVNRDFYADYSSASDVRRIGLVAVSEGTVPSTFSVVLEHD